MDFAALMSKEISKAKNTGSSSDQNDSSKPPEKKYLRRGEVEASRVAAYNEEQERLQREREERNAKKRKAEEEEAERRQEREEKKRRLAEESRKRREEEEVAKERERRKRLGLPELSSASEKEDKEEEEDIPEEELIEKLREMDEPARLFGETHRGRLRRYRRLVQRSLTPQQQLSDGPIPTTLELVPEKDMKISTTLPKDIEGRKYLFRQLASYFNMVLGEWELALAKRDISVKQSLQGRQAYNAMVQSKENMKPLFRKFEKVDVDDSVLEHVVEIVNKAQQRRYVDANDAYLRLSIGKAAWPIGVTMVGIHERSAREKLHQSDQQAHILSDEITRKYLQSIKRCLSFAQVRWPPDDQLQIMG
ncbi:Pre-mRNA-splicing factor 18 [Aspergillus hancockii]|nr:Pre-mRNA-splicing factor 18 [Aspergillus hancockii]